MDEQENAEMRRVLGLQPGDPEPTSAACLAVITAEGIVRAAARKIGLLEGDQP